MPLLWSTPIIFPRPIRNSGSTGRKRAPSRRYMILNHPSVPETRFLDGIEQDVGPQLHILGRAIGVVRRVFDPVDRVLVAVVAGEGAAEGRGQQ